MKRQEIDLQVTTPASPAAVYALLRDGASWPRWSPIETFELEREGAEEPEGLGAVRVFRTGRITSRERIVELVPDRRLSYTLLSGLAIRDYRADIDLEPADVGTRISWHSSFEPRVPGTGGLYRWQLQRFITRLVHGLAEAAGRGSGAPRG